MPHGYLIWLRWLTNGLIIKCHISCLILLRWLTNGPIIKCHMGCWIWLKWLPNGPIFRCHMGYLIWLKWLTSVHVYMLTWHAMCLSSIRLLIINLQHFDLTCNLNPTWLLYTHKHTSIIYSFECTSTSHKQEACMDHNISNHIIGSIKLKIIIYI